MDVFVKYGVKIPNAVLIKYATNTETDNEVADFLTGYGLMEKSEIITDSDSDFHNCIIFEFASGSALEGLREILPYVYICQTKVTYEIEELSVVCSELETKIKTQTYLNEMKHMAKLTGQNYTDVLKSVVSLLGQSITELCPAPSFLKTPPDEDDLAMAAPSTSQMATKGVIHLKPKDVTADDGELPHVQPDPTAHYTSRPSGPLPAMSFSDINPPGVQRYVVEHIMKSDDNAMHMSSLKLKSFSGRTPRPQHEMDYEAWRSGVDLLLKDPAVSELHRSRRIFDSLLPPAADMVKHLQPDAPPSSYLKILDSAYGTVQDGDELYAKFMEQFQDAGEKPSVYLQRLQVTLNHAVRRGGVSVADFEKHLLNQFCRGCWDNTLISELQLKQRKSKPPSFAELLLLLRTEEDREAAKAQRMKQHLGSSKSRASVHSHHAYASVEEKSAYDDLTIITQQLAKQLADAEVDQPVSTPARRPQTRSLQEPVEELEGSPDEEDEEWSLPGFSVLPTVKMLWIHIQPWKKFLQKKIK
ncbi:uncharacterized protein LOC118566998 [Fundulus heteroclitus]|uniref:uncharacterized protein LOC118566998 n=1 Tax=Fundulus heteroclitus TaxID=8078 RepID=UPI00165B1847|nr:uncharacterized protein LOC118566998 [Fundulus heteroclitus]